MAETNDASSTIAPTPESRPGPTVSDPSAEPAGPVNKAVVNSERVASAVGTQSNGDAKSSDAEPKAIVPSPTPPAPAAGAMPSCPGCFRVDLIHNSIVYDYDKAGASHITQEQLDLLGDLKKAEAAIKSIFYPGGLPADLHLRKPTPQPDNESQPEPKLRHAAIKPRQDPNTEPPETEAKDSVPAPLDNSRKGRKLDQTKEKFRSYFYELFALAQIGLDGDTSQPFLARTELASLKNEILTREGGRIKNGYMESLGRNALYFAAAPAVFLVVRELVKISDPKAALLTNHVWQNVVVLDFALVGASIGTFISYALRNPVLSFDQLAVPEEDQLTPLMRLTYVGLITEVFMLTLLLQVTSLSFGPVKTGNLVTEPSLALLIGVLCGIAERAVGKRLQKSADLI